VWNLRITDLVFVDDGRDLGPTPVTGVLRLLEDTIFVVRSLDQIRSHSKCIYTAGIEQQMTPGNWWPLT
jgi:hypothetical protein